ncbi:MAG: methyltransferase domain-containing protein [Methanothrix sp.]|nr:methyltransferase domain-containing protein [Methanothrix sp.]
MAIESWQYNELEHPGMDFDAIAGGYDQSMQKFRDVQGEILEVLAFLDLQPDQTVLEIGTGTGEFAMAAAQHCARVYAVDLSAGMLKHAQRKAMSRGVRNVEFLQGGFLTYKHQGPPLDAVVTQFTLHHLPDLWKQIALIRMAGVLSPGGRLCLRDVVYSFDINEHESFFDGYLLKASKTAGPEEAERTKAHIKKEYSTMGWIMKGMLERAGFRVEGEEHRDGFVGLYLCTKLR